MDKIKISGEFEMVDDLYTNCQWFINMLMWNWFWVLEVGENKIVLIDGKNKIKIKIS